MTNESSAEKQVFDPIEAVNDGVPQYIDPQPRGRARFHLPKTVGNILYRAYFVTYLIMPPLVTVGTIGSVAEILTQGGVSQAVRGIVSPPPPRPEKPDFLVYETENGKTFVGEFLFQLSLRKSIEAYDSWQNFNQLILQDALKRRQPEDMFQSLEIINMNSINEGVGILQSAHLVGLTSDQVQVDPKNQYLWLNDEGFNLANRFDRLLAGTIIQSKIQLIDYNLRLADLRQPRLRFELSPEEISVLSQDVQEDLDYLTWLKKNLPNIELENDSIAFISNSEMVRIARLMQDLDLMKVELPRQIKWCGAYCLENSNATGAANPLTGRTELNPNANAKTLAHEIAHSKFNHLILKFTLLRGLPQQAASEDRLNYITAYAMTNTLEDFAETFANYLMHGDYFRNLLDELKIHDAKSYAALKQKYDFIKNEAAKGLEFTDGGMVRNMQKEQKQHKFAGISWDVASHSLTIQPDPNSWPGKRSFIKEFPVVTKKGKIEKVTVSLDIGSDRPYDNYSYRLRIYHPELVKNLTMQPQAGDNRVYIVNDYKEPSKKLRALGAEKSINFIPPETDEPDEYTSLEIKVQSLSPIKPGQERKLILDIPRDVWESEPIYFVEKVEVVEGPQSRLNTQTQKWKDMWRVKNVVKFLSGEIQEYYAWIQENALGEEVKPENNP